MSLSRVLVWVTVLSWSGGTFLSASEASTSPTCTTDVGQCCNSEGGCQHRPVDQGSDECRLPENSIDQNPWSYGGCASDCTLSPTTFCAGAEPEEDFVDLPVNLTYSVHSFRQFNVKASWTSDIGGRTFKMMLTEGARDRRVSECTCGSTNQTSAVLTSYYNDFTEAQGQGNIHLCLSSSASVRYLKRHFYSGTNCASFVSNHSLDARRCRQRLQDPIGKVEDLSATAISPSKLNVSWIYPDSLKRFKSIPSVYDIMYHVTLAGVQDHHSEAAPDVNNFSVSNSTNITVSGLRPGWNYTVTVTTSVWCESDSCQASRSEYITMPDPPITTTSQPWPAESTSEEPSQTWPAETTEEATNPMTAATALPYSIAIFALLAIVLLLVVTITAVTLCYRNRRKPVRVSAERPCHLAGISTGTISNSISIESTSTPHVETLSRSSSQYETSIVIDPISNCYSAMCGQQLHYIRSPTEILVVGSMRNPTLEHAQNILQPLMSYLNEEIKVHMYNVKLPGNDAELHGTPSVWVEQVLRRVHYVVCICNREFFEDWNYNGEKPCYEASLVNSLSLHFSRLANYSQAGRLSSSFVVGLVQEKDVKYVPESLKHCTPYVLDCEESFERLAGFLSGTPAVEVRR